MKLSLLMVIGILMVVNFISGAPTSDDDWENYKKEHEKNYSPTEEAHRKNIFSDNLKIINDHNTRHAQGLETFTMGLNKYADMTNTEFRKIMNGAKSGPAKTPIDPTTGTTNTVGALPASMDWRTLGAVTPVKDQGQCGSCWSFSATGAMETAWFRKTGKLVSLSEQNLVDCSGSYGNQGCNGGWMDGAFKYVKANMGIDTEAGYPYKATQGSCAFTKVNSGASVTGYTDLPSGSESALQTAVAMNGTISVAIDASANQFQLYKSGIYMTSTCSTTNLDHAVLVVGYGTFNGQDYWLVKNSWGTSWGLSGYFWMARNKNNMCGIATAASYPTC